MRIPDNIDNDLRIVLQTMIDENIKLRKVVLSLEPEVKKIRQLI